ncbi:MAG: ATP-binding protein [Oscillospiraceae bacterium]
MFEEVINGISEACHTNNPQTNADYTDENGLLICGNCRTPKQTDVVILGNTMRVYCACRCAMEAREREKAESRAVEARMRAERMRQEGFYDSAYLSMTFERDDRPQHRLSRASRHYAEVFSPTAEQHGIVFTGNVGTGKTFYACCIANAVIDRGFSAWVTTLPPLIRALSDRVSAKETIERIQRIDLLVLDDLGANSPNDYTTDKMFEIVDARYRCGKPFIVTTNLSADDTQYPSLAMRRIFDRLNERCRTVVVDGESRRKKKASALY